MVSVLGVTVLGFNVAGWGRDLVDTTLIGSMCRDSELRRENLGRLSYPGDLVRDYYVFVVSGTGKGVGCLVFPM